MGKKSVTSGAKEYKKITVLNGACPACGSLKRSDYFGVLTQPIPGETPDGKLYTHIIRRRCACLDCDQHRIEITYEDRGGCSPSESESISQEMSGGSSPIDSAGGTNDRSDAG